MVTIRNIIRLRISAYRLAVIIHSGIQMSELSVTGVWISEPLAAQRTTYVAGSIELVPCGCDMNYPDGEGYGGYVC